METAALRSPACRGEASSCSSRRLGRMESGVGSHPYRL